MTLLFWIGAMAMIVVAVAVIVLPLMRGARKDAGPSHDQVDVALYRERRDELERERQAGLVTDAQFQRMQAELDQQLLADTGDGTGPATERRRSKAQWPTATVVILLPLVAIGLYAVIGAPSAVFSSPDAAGPHDAQAMVQRLVERLEAHPDDGRGWLMLGRSYTVMDQPQKAVHALSRARRLLGDTPAVLLAYARALAATRARPSLLGRPAKLIEKALHKAPDNAEALWLGGLAAIERGDYETARNRWQRLLAQQGPNSRVAARIRKGLAAIGALDNQRTGAALAGAGSDRGNAHSAGAGAIAVSVRLAKSLKDKARPGDTVYIFARAIDGPPMPLAVAKRQVRDLPLTVTLDDADAMMPGRNLSSQEKVQVVARISKSGRAIARPGDLQAAAQTVVVGEQGRVSLIIDMVVE